MTLSMIDTSQFNRRVWTADQLKARGISVVAVRATEGVGITDGDHSWQVAQARQAGAVVMHYHVADYGDSTSEAGYFARVAQPRPGELVMLDNEAQYIETHPAPVASAWVAAFTKQLKKITRAVAVVQYTSRDPITGGFLASVKGREPLFVAEPGATPTAPVPVPGWLISFLQYGTRPSPGGGATDADCAYFGTEAQVRQLAIPQPPAAVTGERTSDGTLTLRQAASEGHSSVHAVLWQTAAHRPYGYGSQEAPYIDAGNWAAAMPKGMKVWVP